MSYDLKTLNRSTSAPYTCTMGERLDRMLADAREYRLTPLGWIFPQALLEALCESGRGEQYRGLPISGGGPERICLVCEVGSISFNLHGWWKEPKKDANQETLPDCPGGESADLPKEEG